MSRVLIVDDEDAVRRTLVRFLVRAGFEVDEAADGRAALAAVERAWPDIVITDVNMPDMDGIELLRALHARDPGLPVIVVSGGGVMPKSILLGNASILGAFATIMKPFTMDEMLSLVEEGLAGGGDQRAAVD